MAIFRLQINPVPRSDGKSSVAAAAYRAGEKIRDDRTGELHNHSRRKDVTHSEIVLPAALAGENMEWARNRASLWNTVENAETRKNSRVAKEIQVNLPHELAPDRRQHLATQFAQEIADHYKVAVDLAVHDPRPSGDPRNYHAHLLLTTREVSPEGLGAKAGLELSRGDRIRLGLPDASQEFTAIRKRWATITNEALKEANIEARVDHRSLAEQGVDREPRPHIPFAAYKIEKAGKYSEVAERIRADYAARVQAREQRKLLAAEHEPPQTATVPTVAAAAAVPAPADATARTQAAAVPTASAPAAAAPATPTAPALTAPKSLAEIRREAREQWQKLRAPATASAPTSAVTPTAETTSTHQQKTHDHDHQP